MQQNYFELTKAIALSDFKLRYHGSVLGIFWSFLKPLLTFGVLYLVFSVFIRFDIENYALYLLLGIILWNFFAEATILSLNSLAGKAPVIKKIAFPRSIIIVSSTLTALLFVIFTVCLYFVALGTSFFISALNAKFKDVRHIWEVLLQLGFWLTPIIYTVSMIPEKLHWFVYLNPMTRVIQYSREAILQQKVSNLDGVFALFLMTLIIFFIGYYVYKKRSPYFAEEL